MLTNLTGETAFIDELSLDYVGSLNGHMSLLMNRSDPADDQAWFEYYDGIEVSLAQVRTFTLEFFTFDRQAVAPGESISFAFQMTSPDRIFYIDSFSLRGTAIPEPSGALLAGLAGFAILARRRR